MKHLGDITKINGAEIPVVDVITGVNPLWASEIEAFPIAVCKKHFGDEDAGIEGDVMNFL